MLVPLEAMSVLTLPGGPFRAACMGSDDARKTARLPTAEHHAYEELDLSGAQVVSGLGRSGTQFMCIM